MITSRLGASKRKGRAWSTILENNYPGKPDGWPRFLFCAGRQGLAGAIPDPRAYKAKQRRTAVFHTVTPMHRANEKETEHGIYPRIHP